MKIKGGYIKANKYICSRILLFDNVQGKRAYAYVLTNRKTDEYQEQNTLRNSIRLLVRPLAAAIPYSFFIVRLPLLPCFKGGEISP